MAKIDIESLQLSKIRRPLSAANLTRVMTRIRARAGMYYPLGDSDVAEFITGMMRPCFSCKSGSDF